VAWCVHYIRDRSEEAAIIVLTENLDVINGSKHLIPELLNYPIPNISVI
jgi:hypothetical protein